MRNLHLVAFNLILAFVIFTGCSSGDFPIQSESITNSNQKLPTLPVGVSEFAPDGSAISGMGTLGLFNLHIDPAKTIAELTSIRDGALTDTLEVVDITNFLLLAPCTECVKIKSISLDADGKITLQIGIRHPFPAGDPLKPITGRNRADLHVFNIEGIVVSNSAPLAFPSTGESIAAFHLLNADGYTGYLDSVLDEIYTTESTLHPYILHFRDYSQGNFNPLNPMGFEYVTDPPPSGNLVMAMGCDYDYQNYTFDIQEPMDFIFAVGCTYAVSAASKSMRFTPEYRIPQHNKKAASEVQIDILSNDLAEGDISSEAELQISIVDVSHNVPVGDALNQMKADSSVGSISIDIPGVTLTPVTVNGGSAVSGTGHDPSDPLIYEILVANAAGGVEGSYPGLIKVTDTYPSAQNASPLLNGQDGIKRVDPLFNPLTGLFNIDEFATYQLFEISVAQSCQPPIPTSINPNTFVNYVGTYDDVVIIGSHFQGSGGVTQVFLDNGVSQVYADDIQVIDDTQLTCDFDITGSDEGFYDVVLVTACEGRGENLLEIIGYPEEWVCVGYNHTNLCQNPNPQTLNPLSMTRVWNNTTSGSPGGFKPTGFAIADGKVFFAASPTSYYYTDANHSLYCLDLDDGQQIWRSYINQDGNYGRALTSPFWHENKVYVGGDHVHCYNDENGSLIWAYDGSPSYNYSFIPNSPKVLDGKAFCTSQSGAFVCLDAETGSEKWTYTYPAGEMLPAVDGERVYFPGWSDLFCLNADDGSFIWTQPLPDHAVAWSGPVLFGDRVYQNGWEGSLNCYDKYLGDLIWSYNITWTVYLNPMPAPFIDPSDGMPVFAFGSATSNSALFAIKDTGSTYSNFWTSYIPGNPYYDGTLTIYEDYIIIGDRFNSRLLVIDKMTGSLAGTQSLDGFITAQPAIAFNRLIVLTDNSVECFM
jgi:outer membrane protein assembly factor BamB